MDYDIKTYDIAESLRQSMMRSSKNF